MHTPEFTDKYRNLLDILAVFENVAIAYSGGVDSTLLSYAACEALTPEKVILLHASSPLLPGGVSENAASLIRKQFSPDVRLRFLEINPLLEQRFIRNSRDRCYVCKKLIYAKLIEEMQGHGINTLLDGTNCDDLNEDRPGHQAISELGVVTPLVDAGLNKRDIRGIAAMLGLKNAELPSNSCLATRIECDTTVEEGMLRVIDEMETFLISLGFTGCRVRPRQDKVILELREDHLKQLMEDRQRLEIMEYFQGMGYGSVLLDLQGRR
jgi:uncharacterized protein